MLTIAYLVDTVPYTDLVAGEWFNPNKIKHHTREIYINRKSLFEQNSLQAVINAKEHKLAFDKKASTYGWYAEVNEKTTVIFMN
ncbi:hypothetical protein [Ochrovirga pacifica]|uniref:hypothetical protein n=1 Tax=Ochrovirga pacifica TaxID=1042376 RepID=UPI000255A54B|nr:hypothetical protein [Ochrovirga pacifica]